MKDYYKTLEVSKNASQQEIKRSYRRLALKYHPDKTSYSGAGELFSHINEAYDVLGKKESRALYDLQRNSISTVGKANQSTKNPYTGGNSHARRRRPVYKPKIDITPYIKYFKGISISAFVFCVLIGFDYFLPSFTRPDQVVAIEMDRYRREYRLKLASGYFSVGDSEVLKLHRGHRVELMYTPLFNKLLKMTFVIGGQKHEYYVKGSIYYNFSFAILLLLITSYFGAFQLKNIETIMNFAIVNAILLVLVFVFLSMS